MSTRFDVWPPLSPLAYLARPKGDLPFPLAAAGVSLFGRARQAIYVGVHALGLGRGDEVLTPAYHHGSEVEALLQAGIVPRFYEATEDLVPDADELVRLLGPRTRALYLIHYLGFPQQTLWWRRFCDDHGLLLFEDAAQAWLASSEGGPVGAQGDLAVFCLYKTIGVGDGAALVLRGEPPAAERGPYALKALALRHQAWLMMRSELVRRLRAARDARRDLEERPPAEDFDVGTISSPSPITELLLRRIPLDDIASRRRAHFCTLLEDVPCSIPPPFDVLPSGASPFAFPVLTERKAKVLEQLRRAGVDGLNFWAIPHPSLPVAAFPAAARRRAATVALPVHQELGPDHVERIANAIRPRPRRDPRLEWYDEIGELRDEWERLALASANVFATWQWASSWWRRYGDGRRLRIATCRDRTGRTVALLPMYEWRKRPVRIFRFVGHGAGDQLGPVCDPADRVAAARALRRALDELDCDVFLGERLQGDQAWSHLLGSRVLTREAYPLLRVAGGWDDYVATRSRHFRKKMLWQERKLGRDHELRYRLHERAETLEADLDILFSLHRSRWGEGTAFGAEESFHRDFAAYARERGWLRLWLLELDGAPAAAWYGFRFAETEFHYQSGLDPARASGSVGSTLLMHTIREALGDGVREYRFLRGDEPYKYRFATGDPGVETFVLALTGVGRAAFAGGRVAARIGPVRRTLRAGLAFESSTNDRVA
jgi:dTDP-4-amino-4,6-dideoxygalactose transaminase/CelD/BcsL family acetyltransferase involved in cellulose biosynthesis